MTISKMFYNLGASSQNPYNFRNNHKTYTYTYFTILAFNSITTTQLPAA